jgi:flavin reductase (DIM6/NTAB) family NADH-FMN oxidoreductase RutF
MHEVDPKVAFHLLKPERVVFVISINEKFQPNGLIAARCVVLSGNPPHMAVSLGTEYNTSKLIKKSKEFVISVANKSLKKYILLFGKKSGKTIDKFFESKVRTTPSKFLKTPMLKDATFNFECKLVKQFEIGTSTVFVGKVLAAYHNKKRKTLFNFGKKFKEL